MAAPSNGSGNLVEEFEESFQSCLNVLTKQEAGPCVEKEEVKVEVERFIDLARQMEAFFLQKRFLLSALKPELLVKEDNNELRLELARKEELLKRHYDKIAVWQNLLADLQGYAKCGGQASTATASGTTVVGQPGVSPAPPGASQAITPVGSVNPINSATVCQPMAHAPHNQMQTQQQMQHAAAAAAAQAAQLQQMQQMHQQQHAMQMPGGGGVPQGMFMQQGPRGAFPQGGSLQGPLAYLEKTTTNIDLVGMGDGRR